MVMGRWQAAVAALATSGLLLTGCAGTPAATTTAGTARLSLIAAAYPLEFLAERIAGDSATVTDLTAPGAEPHDLELTARQVADLTTTDAVIYIAGFQAAVDQAIATAAPKLTIDAAAGVDRLAMTADEEATESGSHPGAGLDPHLWLSPANMKTMAATISAKLSAAHPELADTFSANTAKLTGELTTLDDAYRAGLAHCARTQFITSHAAFGYLAQRYGLQQIPIAGLDPTQEPTAARIAEVQRLAKQYGVTTIFFETLVSNAVATSIAGDLGLKSAVLDPIEGITKASAGTDYLDVMNSNLTALREANGCR